jgi:protein SCO1/2
MMRVILFSHILRVSVAATMIIGATLFAQAQTPPKDVGIPSTEQARELKDVGIQEKLGGSLDLLMKFKNEKGEEVTLGSFYDGKHPVVISLIYFACPGLCNFHLNGVVESLKEVDWTPGQQFQYLAISFDSKETPELAAKKKETYMKLYSRPGSEGGWHFLTADESTVQKLTAQLGFQYKWVEESQEWAHASAAMLTTPRGTISRYLHGIMFDPKTFKLALNEAGDGKIGTFVDRMIWYCFHYDPSQSKYTLYATNIMKIGGVLIILILAALMVPQWIRSRREQELK